MQLWSVHMPSPVGVLKLIAHHAALVAVLWEDDAPTRVKLAVARNAPDHPILADAQTQLAAYFAGRAKAFDMPLDPIGTPFQRDVWAALQTIPYGETRSYAAIAAHVGRPQASRAVGSANGKNPISIIVPCHRVVGATGHLTGFAGGLAAKQFLLSHETASDTARQTQQLTLLK